MAWIYLSVTGPAAAYHGLVQDCGNSSALAVELLQSCAKSLMPWSQNSRYIRLFRQWNTQVWGFEEYLSWYMSMKATFKIVFWWSVSQVYPWFFLYRYPYFSICKATSYILTCTVFYVHVPQKKHYFLGESTSLIICISIAFSADVTHCFSFSVFRLYIISVAQFAAYISAAHS